MENVIISNRILHVGDKKQTAENIFSVCKLQLCEVGIFIMSDREFGDTENRIYLLKRNPDSKNLKSESPIYARLPMIGSTLPYNYEIFIDGGLVLNQDGKQIYNGDPCNANLAALKILSTKGIINLGNTHLFLGEEDSILASEYANRALIVGDPVSKKVGVSYYPTLSKALNTVYPQING